MKEENGMTWNILKKYWKKDIYNQSFYFRLYQKNIKHPLTIDQEIEIANRC